MKGFAYQGNTMFWPGVPLSLRAYSEALDGERQRLLWVLLQRSTKPALNPSFLKKRERKKK